MTSECHHRYRSLSHALPDFPARSSDIPTWVSLRQGGGVYRRRRRGSHQGRRCGSGERSLADWGTRNRFLVEGERLAPNPLDPLDPP